MNTTPTPVTRKELSLEDLRDNFAVIVNNAITEGREGQIGAIVDSYRAQRGVRPGLLDRIREFLAS